MAEQKQSESAPVEDNEGAKPRTDEEIVAEASARLKLAEEAEADARSLALEDLEFRSGKQWPTEVVAARQRDGRPCLVINRIPQFIQQVTNDQRQNRPSIKVHPVDDGGDVETGKVIQGLIRHIEYNSNADVAYDTAFDSAATSGFGYFRIITDFVNPLSFEQEILIKRIRDPRSVYLDVHSSEPDGSDANWGFIEGALSKDEFKTKHPDAELSMSGEWEAFRDSHPDWFTKDSVRVLEYFYRETSEQTLYMLSNGQAVLKDGLAKVAEAVAASGQPISIVNERQTMVPVIQWCKINGKEILEKTTWLGKWIPIIPVYGNELYINGKRVLEGIVRNAKDSQRMYNYWASAETEAIALAPRTPFIVAEGQIEGHEAAWNTANTRNHAYLQYKATMVNGQMAAPPQRNSFEPAVQAITQARMMASDDLKATTGIYDAALGNRSNESSGVAIQRRAMQAQTSTFHFIDNLTRSLRHAGRILVDLIPKIYDTARTARIVGEDGEQKIVKLNQDTGELGKDGKPLIYALDAGKYDVTVDVGPSFASKRQEAVQSMLELSAKNPQITQLAGDLMVKNMDWPGAQEISDRLKKALPPGIADDESKEKQPIPPQVQQQLQQQGDMLKQLTDKVNEQTDIIQNKRIEIESKERIEFAKLDTQTTIELAKIDAKDSIILLQSQLAQIEGRMRLLNADQPIQDVTQDQEVQAIDPAGAYPGAESGDGGLGPTGGVPPGQPMEMESNDVQPNLDY